MKNKKKLKKIKNKISKLKGDKKLISKVRSEEKLREDIAFWVTEYLHDTKETINDGEGVFTIKIKTTGNYKCAWDAFLESKIIKFKFKKDKKGFMK